MYSEGLRGIRDLTYGKGTSVAEIDNQISMILQETGLLIDNLLKKLITEHRNDIKKRFYDLNICIEGENNDAIVVDIGTSSVNSLKDCLKWLQNSTGNVGIHTNLLKIVDEVTGIMKEFVGRYTDSKSGIFACEIGKYQSKYSEKYEQAVEAWYVKEKKEEMDDWKNKVEDLQEDIIRVDNRRFSVDSVRTQLKRKMEKNSR